MENTKKYFSLGVVLAIFASVEGKGLKKSTTVSTPVQEVAQEEAEMSIMPVENPQRVRVPQQKQTRYGRQYQSSINSSGQSVSISAPDVSETKDNVVVTMQISGFTADEITANVEGNNIRIIARSGHSNGQNTISNSFPLPCPVNARKMVKKLSNGVLTITLPKL